MDGDKDQDSSPLLSADYSASELISYDASSNSGIDGVYSEESFAHDKFDQDKDLNKEVDSLL